MGVLKRYFENGYAYFLTTNTLNDNPIFFKEQYCRILLVTIEYFKLILDYKLYGYCIMPDHLHLLLHPYGRYDPAYIMQMIKGSFSNKYNKMKQSKGHVWQKRYYDEVVRNNKVALNILEYMHNNPVKAKIVQFPEDYEFSSCSHYFGSKKANMLIEIDCYS